MPLEKIYLTNREAADYLRISVPTLWRLRKAGKVAYTRNGLRCLFDRRDLDAFMARGLVNASAGSDAKMMDAFRNF